MSEHIFLSEEQERVIEAIKKGRNVLVTGSAGTGKSTILKAMKEEFGADLPVCASTGIAAVNVGGTTVHSWAGLGLGKDSAEKIAKGHLEVRGRVYRRIKQAKQLAIDEISMIHGELFNLMDQVFRLVREQPLIPFGGIQLILFGDFLQLPPVSKDQDSQQFAFQSRAWRDAAIQTFMLTRVFRQEDAAFSSALNQIRVGNMTPEVIALLKSRLKVTDPDPAIEPVTVYTHNEDVERMNAERLRGIKGEEKTWEASDWGEPGPLSTLQKNCLAPQTLRLKVGAQVMLLWNVDPSGGLANGSIGTVTGWGQYTGLPKVKFRQGREIEVEGKSWEIRVGGDVLASRGQIPLRLAWAITAHKSQGMTLDKIKVHLDRAFEFGQSYVALSRARTLEGLFIESSKPGCIKAHPEAVRFYLECGA